MQTPYIYGPGFSGVGCFNYDIQTTSDAVVVTLQDEQNLLLTGKTNEGLATNHFDCSQGQCQSRGVVALNDTAGTYFFLATYTDARQSSGWVTMNYTFLPVGNLGITIAVLLLKHT